MSEITIVKDNTKVKSLLQELWIDKIERLPLSITEPSALECASRCKARCCPKTKREGAIGHVAIMLPFEMEYILSKTGVSLSLLHQAKIEFQPGVFLNIGYTNSSAPCPFLTVNNHCGIYDIRPLDCRSFPLIPYFNQKGSIDFRIDNTCPSAMTFSTKYQIQMKTLWQSLLPSLPMTYRQLYNQL